MKEQISEKILICKNIIEIIRKVEPPTSLNLEQELNKLLEDYKRQVKEFNDDKSILKLNSMNIIEANLIIELDNFIQKYGYFKDIHIVETYFENFNIEDDYESILNDYDEIMNILSRITNKIDVDKSIKLTKQKYDVLFQIICKGVLEKKKLPILDNRDLEQIRILIESELTKINPQSSNGIDISNLKDYIEYINEYKNSTNKKEKIGFFDKIKDNFSKYKSKSNDKSDALGNSTYLDKPKLSQQEIGESIYGRDLRKYNLSEIDFTDVCVEGANLEGTGAKIDPQKVKDKNLNGTNLKGLDLSDADFTNVVLTGANLENTGAVIELDKVGSLLETNLTGVTFYCNQDFEDFDKLLGAIINGIKIDENVQLPKRKI